MKTEKVTTTIKIEVLDIKCVPSLLYQVIDLIDQEDESGFIRKPDGDCVGWETTRDPVEF